MFYSRNPLSGERKYLWGLTNALIASAKIIWSLFLLYLILI
ncbi:hypothetical protein Niako_3271 [Niastella koreensis GR20-10]|uniref:Uncharacterized protein n=1 Tax=Niastella koreensis (strain DSM 17620 / KACC 11465 / NBRC 106392 / GR20-10) TaxID=700598 RepID=G8THZ2_NIAKG|nr:hypothetical protein Niako_3271 [Niastella koreensis GR20-10]